MNKFLKKIAKASVCCALVLSLVLPSASVSHAKVHEGNMLNWMEGVWAVVGNKTFNELTIPSAHDSGTYSLITEQCGINDVTNEVPDFFKPITDLVSEFGVKQFIKSVSMCQGTNIYHQLCMGNRALDIRFKDNYRGEVRIFHGGFGAMPREIFSQIKTFLDQTKKEVLLLNLNCGGDLGSFSGKGKEFLLRELHAVLGNYIAPSADFNINNKLQDFVDANKRVIFVSSDPDLAKDPLVWNMIPSKSNWTCTMDFNTMKNFQMDDYNKNCKNAPQGGFIYNMPLQLSVDPGEVVKRIFTDQKNIALVDMVNHNRDKFKQATIAIGDQPGDRLPNIISRDFADIEELELIIMKNFGHNRAEIEETIKNLKKDWRNVPNLLSAERIEFMWGDIQHYYPK